MKSETLPSFWENYAKLEKIRKRKRVKRIFCGAKILLIRRFVSNV